MFPDSEIAKSFSKTLKETVLPFSLHFDETSNAQVKKQMDLLIRYWSPTHDEIWVCYYISFFFRHADGHTVSNKIYQQLKDDGAPLDKLSTLIRDGPNVYKTIFRSLESLIKRDHADFRGFVDLSSCMLHTVHNAFGKVLEKFAKDVEQLCIDVYSLFKYSSARREVYLDIHIEYDVKFESFRAHTDVRWLSLSSAVHVLIRQFDPISKFVEDLGRDEKTKPKKRCI